MYRTIARLLTSFFVQAGNKEDIDEDIIAYGFEMLVSAIVTAGLTLVCGIIFHRFLESVIFLAFLCPLREYAGGFHAKNYIRCTCSFLSLYLFVIGLDMILAFWDHTMFLYVLMLFSGMIIFVLAPVDTENKRLGQQEKNFYRKQSRVILLLEVFVICICFIWKIEIFRYGAFALMCVAILLLIGFSTNKEVVYHDERTHNNA